MAKTQYELRACHRCGAIKPQPEMRRVTVKAEWAQSQRSLSKRELFGAALGNERSVESIKDWAFKPNKRKYMQTSTVWACRSGCESGEPGNDKGSAVAGCGCLILALLALIALAGSC